MVGNRNPNPNLAMMPQSQTLTLILSLLFASASSLSPSPSSSPSPSPAISIAGLPHPPPLTDILLHRPSPPLCESDRIDCLANEYQKLNFGKKIGIVFLAAAILLQVVLAGFLVYKRIQLKKLNRKRPPLVLRSDSS